MDAVDAVPTGNPSSPPHVHVVPHSTEPDTLVLIAAGPIARDDILRLCCNAYSLMSGTEGDPIRFDVGALSEPDAAAVDALARLQLVARRLGRRIEFQADDRLRELLDLMGLSNAVRTSA